MIDATATYAALLRLRNHGEPTDAASLERELNEACGLTGAERIDVGASLGVLKTRGQVECVEGAWRLRDGEEATEQRRLF